MAIKITGKVGDLSVDLSIEATEDLKALIAALTQNTQENNNETNDRSPELMSHSVKPDTTHEMQAVKQKNFFEKSLDFVKQQKSVTNYQLIDFLADNGADDAEIKRAMMRLKHSHLIKLETISGPGQSSYLKFHWQGE